MSEWQERAACNGHPNPEQWYPIKRSDHCDDAKRVCQRCPVRRECGEYALKIDERWAVMAGYRCSESSERDELKRWLGRDATHRRVCTSCGVEFATQQSRRQCLDCRGLVPVDESVAHVRALRAAGLSNAAISALSGVAVGTVERFSAGGLWGPNCSRDIAERLRSVPAPEGVGV